jgi:glutamate/tyrosine decarboxylase-like PLP-dependent enzyme
MCTRGFDPIADAATLAHQHKPWVHTDGAFGLWAAGSPWLAHLVDGRADVPEIADSAMPFAGFLADAAGDS